ncbi:MAG: hypothetical protein A3B95_00370 [Candidatus Doudnabacteria bacterium RIFCSPHIGHO2_02_FULL_43_13b]|nr:MAG: hypothetical protein A3B95_00370 [Candidatus Doudnabacteria bacterium RIFCSPHIGHO2_02_FULL_43_13b]
MNLTNIDELKNFLKHSGLRPKDYLGQNFLVDQEVLQEIILAADLKPTDTVLEVGPGLGVLTEELLKKAGKVIAVEKDERLFEILSLSLRGGTRKRTDEAISPEIATRPSVARDDKRQSVKLIHQDILRFHLEKYISGPYKVVANIPYYLTSKLFQYFLQQQNKPKLLVLMVQKEVGERVAAKVGDLSVLGISVQIQADVEIVQRRSLSPSPRLVLDKEIGDLIKGSDKIPDPAAANALAGRQVRDGFGNKQFPLIVPKTSFWPVPEVDSVILKITPKEKFPEIKDQKFFFSIVKMAFAGKRKQIKNTIKNIEALHLAGIDPTTRPQDISIEQWIILYKMIDKLLLKI